MEESQEQFKEEIPNKTEEKRNPDGTFAKGTVGGPGRKPGQTLKEFWKQKFRDMTDEEKEAFSIKVGNEAIWKMAEGLPKADLEVTAKVTMSDLINNLEDGNREQTASIEAVGQIVEIAALVQDTGQAEEPVNLSPEPSTAALPTEQVVEKYHPEE